MRLPKPDKNGMYSGKQLISTAIPPFVNTKMEMKLGFDEDIQNTLVVKNVQLVDGILNKKVYSSMTKRLIH